MSKLRYAAIPAGHMHVRHARIALANFLLARRHDGQFQLRIDDLDDERLKPEFAESIVQDLRWLGIDWNEELHQSDRLQAYHAAADRLKPAGTLFETEAELRAKRDQRIKRGLPAIYDRAMLSLTPAQREAAEAGGKRPHWRFRLADPMARTMSDPVVMRADGTPLGIFTSVVDDIATGITHVIRGEDRATTTAAQIDMIVALDGNPRAISFVHLPLLQEGALGRRIDRMTLRALRNDGVTRCAITNYLARPDIAPDDEPLSMTALAQQFDPTRLARSSTQFDAARLLAVNRHVLRTLPYSEVADRLPNGATEAFWLAVHGDLDLLGEARGWWDVVAGTIVPPIIDGQQEFLHTALDALPPEPWDGAVWTHWTEAIAQATGRHHDALMQPLRLALTGEDDGPDLHDLLPLIGRARAANRLQLAAT